MVFSAGSGSGGQWVDMDATSQIRAYFRKFVDRVITSRSQSKATEEWKKEAAHILHYMDSIGRVAAHRSIAACQYSIDATVMRDAIQYVVAAANGRTTIAGKWCGA